MNYGTQWFGSPQNLSDFDRISKETNDIQVNTGLGLLDNLHDLDRLLMYLQVWVSRHHGVSAPGVGWVGGILAVS